MLIFDVVACDVRVNSPQTSKDEVKFSRGGEDAKKGNNIPVSRWTKRRFPVVGYEHVLKSVTDVKNGI